MILPEYNWREAVRPCFVVVGCTLDVAVLGDFGAVDAAGCSAADNGMKVLERRWVRG